MPCKYNTLEFEEKIYLFTNVDDKIIRIDNGSAFINDLDETPYILYAKNIQYSENETLNERYRFETTLEFTVDGYANLSLIKDKYYAAICTKDGRWLLVNVDFSAYPTYAYTLNSTTNETVYTYHTLSNYPSLFFNWDGDVDDPVYLNTLDCKYLPADADLYLILKKYINIADNIDSAQTITTGFEKVDIITGSLEVTESFDGNYYTQSVTFNRLNTDAWQYLIGEFHDNTYVAKINARQTVNYYLGTDFGLQPTYTIDGDVVTITLTEQGNKPLATITNEFISPSTIKYRYIKTEFDPCVTGKNQAYYLLREQTDNNGNGNGRYECKVGYSQLFDDYNIVGTFSDDFIYYSNKCAPSNTKFYTDLPHKLEYYGCWGPNSSKKNQFTFRCNYDWEVTSGSITPTSGEANVEYTLTVPKYYFDFPSDTGETIVISAGNATYSVDYYYYGSSEKNRTVYIPNNTITINCTGQKVRIPVNTDIIDWNNVEWSEFNELPVVYKNGYLEIDFLPNESTEDIYWQFDFTADDFECGTGFQVIQKQLYVFWASDNDKCDYICNGTSKCYKEYKWTGITSNNTVKTDEYRVGQPFEGNSRDCMDIITKWEQTYNILCVDGVAFFVDLQYESTDNANWTLSGGVRLREQATNASIDACINPEYEWRITENTVCDN